MIKIYKEYVKMTLSKSFLHAFLFIKFSSKDIKSRSYNHHVFYTYIFIYSVYKNIWGKNTHSFIYNLPYKYYESKNPQIHSSHYYIYENS